MKSSRPQRLTLCRSLHAQALQATVSEGLAQEPYVAARARFEPMTLWSKGIDSTNAPPRPNVGHTSLLVGLILMALDLLLAQGKSVRDTLGMQIETCAFYI